MDLTVYLFDSRMVLKQGGVITHGIVQLIHKERARTLSAEIPVKYAAKPGEYLGFRCVDGKFRLFCVEYADDDDNTATTIITAADAAKDELAGKVMMVTEQESAGIAAAAADMLTAAGWTLGLDETDGKTTAVEGGLRSAWDVLEAFEKDGNLFVDPYYEFDGKSISGRVVDLLGKHPVYTGRLVQRGTDAENIVITHKNRPRPMIYPQGADGLTIADVVWSLDKGDPVDKPQGQIWIGVPEAVALYPGQGQVLEVDTDDPSELAQKGWEKAQASAEPGLTATATISDMEMIRGQSWKSVRLFYIVRVRPRFGRDAEAQVIEIARNYVRNDETKITLGEEPDSSANQIRSLAKTTAANVKEIGKYKAEFKDMLVTVEELDEYTRTTVTEAWLDLKASTESSFAQIGTRLDSTDAKNDEQFRTLSESILTLESDLDSASAELAARITQIQDGDIKTLSEAVLDLEATVDEATASLSARVGENEAKISATATELGTRIDLKADKTHVTNLVANEIEAVKTSVQDDISESVVTGSLTATSGVIGALTLGGDPIKKTTISVVTGITGGMAQTEDVEFLTSEVGATTTVELGSATELSAMYTQGTAYDGPLYGPGASMTIQGKPVPVKLYSGFGTEDYLRGTKKTVTPVGSKVSASYPTLYAYEGDGIYTAVYTGNMYYAGTAKDYYLGDGALAIGIETDFEANTLYYAGTEARAVGDPITDVQLYREGTYYAGGLYTDFEPALVTMQSLKALTTNVA